ncbi:MAG: anhydro-N-acetylmuramic acid kinase [Betaproteobacteria bacterium HGW-Betaproteobacteria-11]|nr:MAG: anhydro-N-acetylmuramic acid kinase [Betaproteobacteria bacterium HGW-Betaproteobacteria-11]
MSGTSLDGVDAVLVDCSSSVPRLLASAWLPYPPLLRTQAARLQASGADELNLAARLANELAQKYAEATQQLLGMAGVSPQAVAAIGCHGQTVRHRPEAGYSIQLNNPALLAELTGITVVADFRSRDIAAGGQGAPLVPAFHAAVFGDPGLHRIILNIGGMANLTDLQPRRPPRGFDCGPGNVLLDAWMERNTGKRYDADGCWATRGYVQPALLEQLLAHPFFQQEPPRSCGRDEFNLAWLTSYLEAALRPEDVQATLLELTASSIAEAITHWCGIPDELLVCGGGVHNLALMERLRVLLPVRRIASTDFLGQPPDWVEASAFAWLAWRTVHRLPGNLPAATGARGPRILGAIYPA